MRKLTILLTCLVALLLIWLAAEAQERSSNGAAKALHALFASEWDYQMQQNPTWASTLGDRRWNDRWEDVSLDAIQKRHEHDNEVLARLKEVDRSKLTPRDQLNYDLFKQEYERRVEEHPYRWYLIPLNQRSGIQTADELADSLRFETVKDYEDWIVRLRAFRPLMDQTIALMREGTRAHILLPKVIVQRIPAQIDKQLVSDPEASPFYKPFKRVARTVSEADRLRLSRAAKEAILAQIVPAFQAFKRFFVEEYLPASLDRVGIWQLPNGERMYAFFARKYTTTNLTPKEIHEIGLSEVKRIRAQMQAIMDKSGFKGTLPEFFKFLRTDSRFYCKSSEELLTAYRAIAKRIDPHLITVFKTLPRMPYGVEPIPEAVAPDTTTAYYRAPAADGSRAGTFFVNLYKPEARPVYEMMALSLHEAVPGHHLQIALAMEQGDIPNFRRYGGYGAFVEGWGLYAESLGEDMRLYDDPYSKFGQLTYEMWRAVRLVVDTGMHAMRWDRQKAINFFMENAAKTELDVVNEIDRYIAWPGQALGYKVGELKFKQLRERARRALGDRFDLREYHDVVLRSGALPLDILEQNVNEWIDLKKQR